MLDLWSRYFPEFLRALGVTIELTLWSTALAVAVGGVLASAGLSQVPALRWLAGVFIDIIQAVPLLVLLFLAYYGLSQAGMSLSGPVAAVVALTVFHSTQFAQIIRAGWANVDSGQHEAAAALGMGTSLKSRKVIGPQALLAILIPATNQVSNIIKDTALVLTIGVADLMNKAYQASAETYRPMSSLALAGVMYLVIYFVLARLIGGAERRVQRRYYPA